MPEDAGERTEAPTPRRRQEARRRGQVARSQDLTAAIILLGTMVALNVIGPAILGDLIGMLRYCLGSFGQSGMDPRNMSEVLWLACHVMLRTVGPVMLVAAGLALAGNAVQIGWLLTAYPLKPSLAKLNLINGAKRLFSSRSLVQIAQNLAKTGLVVLVAFVTIKDRVDQIVYAMALHHVALLGVASELLFLLAIRLGLVLLVLALLDYAYQRYRHEKDLKMTKQEVKEELRRMEGDPLVRRRRREVQLQLTIQRIRAAVPQADVVVTNPVELAIALKYDAETMNAPKVIAKGKGYVAQRIRQVAIEFGVPIVERRPLAQAMYKAVEVGQEIPPRFYKAIAEILAYVYELAGRGYTRRAAAAG